MKIGSPKESKDQEYRAGLTPKSVANLIRDGKIEEVVDEA